MIDALTFSALSWVITCSSAHGSEHVAVDEEQLFVRDLVGAAQAAKGAGLLLVRERGGDVDPLRVVETRGRVRDGDDRRTLLGEELRQEAPDVAEPLDRDAQALERELALADGLLDAIEAAARSRLHPSERAAHVERLAGDDAEHRVPLVHRVRVEDPGHHRPVGADVRGRDVLLGADLVDDLRRVAAGHPFELAPRQLLGVANHAAFCAAERDVHQRALPGHPHGERLDLVERDVRVVADAALGRAARDVVRDAVALVRDDRAVVHRHRRGDDHRLLAFLEDVHEPLVDGEDLGDALQLLASDVERVLSKMAFRSFDCGHSVSLRRGSGTKNRRKRAKYRTVPAEKAGSDHCLIRNAIRFTVGVPPVVGTAISRIR